MLNEVVTSERTVHEFQACFQKMAAQVAQSNLIVKYAINTFETKIVKFSFIKFCINHKLNSINSKLNCSHPQF